MRKTKTFLIDLTVSTVLTIAIIVVLDAAGNMISNVSLSFAEQIMTPEHDR